MRHYRSYFVSIITCALLISSAAPSQAQNIKVPSSANIDRYQQDLQLKKQSDLEPSRQSTIIERPNVSREAVPEGAKDILFTLQSVDLKGNTAYTDQELQTIWQKDIGQKISVQRLYDISAEITAIYRHDGYIISSAYIPAQEIDSGNVSIQIVEGYISDISYDGKNGQRSIIRNTFKNIKSSKPLNIHDLESELLLLNDLAGTSYRTVLKSLDSSENAPEGAVALHIAEERTSPFDGRLEINNSGSRYIGPYLATAALGYEYDGWLAFQRTDFLLSTTLPADELKYFNLSHSIPLTSNGISLIVDAAYSLGDPGYKLKRNDIDSRTASGGARLEWKAIRQRAENLVFSLGANIQNNSTDILKQELSRDYVRNLEFKTSYSWDDFWLRSDLASSNNIAVSMEKGFEDVFGGSSRGDRNLTRAMGHPDAEILKATIFRLQALPYQFSILAGATGQIASGPLLSSQEFGYGGSTFGRAYDPSEIVGDNGFSTSLELRYGNIPLGQKVSIQPFVYGDFGKVWNKDAGQPKKASAATAGGGVRLSLPFNINASFTVAQPLAKSIDAPQYGNGKNPRYLFSFSTSF